MGKFYLDMEFTNGNYYLANILEIALVAGESGIAFHSYIKTHYSVLHSDWLNFSIVQTLSIIIAHDLHDFPILLASCMKHNCNKFGILAKCMFVDSMQILQDDGYKRPGRDALYEELNIKGSSHSALEDAYILKAVCNKKPGMPDHPYGYTFGDITYLLNRKLSLPLRQVYILATECASHQELGCILYEYVKTKSALNLNQVCKIAHWYFKDRYLYCK